MTEPVVCGLYLSRCVGRDRLRRMAISCLYSQSYVSFIPCKSLTRVAPIGTLRNEAVKAAIGCFAPRKPDIIAHFDDDDWSAPERIAEQVKLLQESEADAVGYNEMYFADVRGGKCEAWRYKHPRRDYLIGTSLCYWRHVWERHPFMDLPIPGNPQSACEDTVWQSGLNCVAVPDDLESPRMIATLHGGNTRLVIDERSDCWTRMPERDKKLRAILEAA